MNNKIGHNDFVIKYKKINYNFCFFIIPNLFDFY